MKIYREIYPHEFEAWGGAKETMETIAKLNLTEKFDMLVDNLFPSMSEEQFNDWLWFEQDAVFELLKEEGES